MSYPKIAIAATLSTVCACGPIYSSYPPNEPGGAGVPAGGAVYALPKALVRVRLSDRGDRFDLIIEQPTIVADDAPSASYQLRYLPSATSSDTADIEADPKTGLLKSVKMKAEDKLSEIVKAAARSAAVFAESAVEGEAGTDLVDRMIDPADPKEVSELQSTLNRTAMLRASERRAGACADQDQKAACQSYTDIATGKRNIAFKIDAPSPYSATDADCSVGLCYRMPRPYGIGFSFGPFDYQTVVSIPNNMPAAAINLSRATAVTRATDVTLVDGMLSTSHDEKPSELLAIVSWPRDIFDAFITSLSQIIALRIDLSEKEKSLADKEVARIQAERALREQQINRSPEPESVVTGPPLLQGSSEGRITKASLATTQSGANQTNPQQGQTPQQGGTQGGTVDLGSPGTLPGTAR